MINWSWDIKSNIIFCHYFLHYYWRYRHFTQKYPAIMIICYVVPEICCVTDILFIFHFGLFLSLYTPKRPKNQNLKKMKKTHGYIIILHMYSTNYDYMMYSSWDRLCNRQMNGWTDRQKKWHREVELEKNVADTNFKCPKHDTSRGYWILLMCED